MSGILDLFVPREKKFFVMLSALSEKTHSGAKQFLQFIHDYGKLSIKERQAVAEGLKRTERECDEITHQVAIELNKTFLTPFDREDIHGLATLTDDIMDMVYNVSYKLILYNIRRIPKHVPELAALAYACTKEINTLISELGRNKKVGLYIRKIHELEEAADSLRNEALAYLFNDSMDAADIIKLKDIYEWLEGITDKSEDIADVVEGIVIKYA